MKYKTYKKYPNGTAFVYGEDCEEQDIAQDITISIEYNNFREFMERFGERYDTNFITKMMEEEVKKNKLGGNKNGKIWPKER